MNAALVISDRDNVATALEVLTPGRLLTVGGHAITVGELIPAGHKLALRAVAAGEPVIKYGSAIGLASADIPAGAHVHVHNVASGRGRGDLSRVEVSVARLAEPEASSAEPGPAHD